MKSYIMRKAAVALVLWISAFALLLTMYPWSVYYTNFTFGRSITLWSYIIVASATAFVILLAVSVPLRKKIEQAALRGFLTAFIAFALLTVAAILLGPMGTTVPGTRVRGIFFSEWKFLTFIFKVALPLSILGSVVTQIPAVRLARPKRTPTSH